jgi:hypothetical protein
MYIRSNVAMEQSPDCPSVNCTEQVEYLLPTYLVQPSHLPLTVADLDHILDIISLVFLCSTLTVLFLLVISFLVLTFLRPLEPLTVSAQTP